MAVDTRTAPPLPCPYIAGGGLELCCKPAGHRGLHRPGDLVAGQVPVISERRARRICGRIRAAMQPGSRLFLKPRCPGCHTVAASFHQGTPTSPTLTGDTGQVVREWDLSFGPCGHTFRWVSELRSVQ